jgi:TolB-like protein/Flp pilus assembly protein TadD
VILVAGVFAVWNFYLRPDVEPASVEKMAFPLPDKPSIAVLPFVNMSGDQSDEFIADGLSENIISSLSKIPGMLVIARNSTFVYKGKAVKVNRVAEELGVRYVFEGSVQRSGENMRVTAQLVDAIKGHYLWSERYDRKTKDFFFVQDEITRNIVIALQVELTEGDQARIWHDTENLEAWGYATKGITLFQHYTKEKNAKSRDLFKKAVELDPNYAVSWIFMAWTHLLDFRYGWGGSRAESLRLGIEIVQKASALDDTQPEVHSFWNTVYLFQSKYDNAIAEGKQAIALGPSDATSHILLSMALHFAGNYEEAMFHAKEAMRLSPYYPNWYLKYLAMSYCMAEEYEKAITVLEKVIERAKAEGSQVVPNYLFMVHALVGLGRVEQAKALATSVLKLDPNLALENWQKSLFYKDRADLDRHLEALRKAGLPETPPLPLPDKPSIAVLPFVNMSGDPEQEYFSDGITEEIITALSKTPEMFVIARTSSFKYKDKEVDVRTVGRELGVRYVLEGSVRQSEDQLRITAQLIDTKTRNHLWAERYDRKLKDIFAIQDEITIKIITALGVKLTEGEQVRLGLGRSGNLEAYMKGWKALGYFRRMNTEGNVIARHELEEAIALAPESSSAYALLAMTYIMDLYYGSSESPLISFAQASKFLKKAIALDNENSDAHLVLANLYLMKREHGKAIASAERGIALNPNGADAYANLGYILSLSGRSDEAIEFFEKAIRLNPIPPSYYLHQLGNAFRNLGRYEEAIEAYKKALQRSPTNLFAHIGLAVTYVSLGHAEEAHNEAAEVGRIDPKFSLEQFAKTIPFKNKADTELYIDALRKAGLK